MCYVTDYVYSNGYLLDHYLQLAAWMESAEAEGMPLSRQPRLMSFYTVIRLQDSKTILYSSLSSRQAVLNFAFPGPLPARLN